MQSNIYFTNRNGEKVQLGVAEDIEVKFVTEAEKKTEPSRFTTVGSFTMHLTRLDALSILFNRKITNNWLKMHGGVMTRRTLAQRRKGRR